MATATKTKTETETPVRVPAHTPAGGLPLLPREGEAPRPLLPGHVPAWTRQHDTPANRETCARLARASHRLNLRAEAAWRAYSDVGAEWDVHITRFLADSSYDVPEELTARMTEERRIWRFWHDRYLGAFNRWQALYWALDEAGCYPDYSAGGQELDRQALIAHLRARHDR